MLTQVLAALRRCHWRVVPAGALPVRVTVKVEPFMSFCVMPTFKGPVTVKLMSPLLTLQETPSVTLRLALMVAESTPAGRATSAVPEMSVEW